MTILIYEYIIFNSYSHILTVNQLWWFWNACIINLNTDLKFSDLIGSLNNTTAYKQHTIQIWWASPCVSVSLCVHVWMFVLCTHVYICVVISAMIFIIECVDTLIRGMSTSWARTFALNVYTSRAHTFCTEKLLLAHSIPHEHTRSHS